MSIFYCYCFLQLLFATIHGLDTTTIVPDEDYSIEIIEDSTTPVNEFLIDDDDENATTTENYENDFRILNKDFDKLGKIYVSQYYSLFDDPKKRLSLVALYHAEDSFMTFEGQRYRGTKKILEKFEALKLKSLKRTILSIDTQPLHDGGVIINVIGKVHENDKKDYLYAQTFIYKPQKGSFFLQHDIFRVIRP
ncbi:probable nuclear transport factor 2 [Chironomus tepperi]|uniref:probable nuclear transport factor 2 n=1 Tax=Chironomus tepperi TaxID=113505 RepID=UPI00391F0D43